MRWFPTRGALVRGGFVVGLAAAVVVGLGGCSGASSTAGGSSSAGGAGRRTAASASLAPGTLDVNAACAQKYLAMPAADVVSGHVNAYGCGDAVHLTEGDMAGLFPALKWGEDTGHVDHPVPSLSVVPPDSCDAPAGRPAPIVGAQVVELLSFGPSTDSPSIWQNVLVFSSRKDAADIYRGRVARAQCPAGSAAGSRRGGDVGGDSSADSDYRREIERGLQLVTSGDRWSVLRASDYQGPDYFLVSVVGNYYSEIHLPGAWVAGSALTSEGTTFVGFVQSKLGKGL